MIEGKDISISISASGNPAITKFTWKAQKVCPGFDFVCKIFCDPQTGLQLPDNFQIEDSRMEVRNIKREDAGLYFLMARNNLGDKTLQVFLTVNYHPT